MRFKIVLLLIVAGIGLTIFFGGRYLRLQEYRKLAVANCSSCHLFPEPNLLDKDKWINGVLPEMAIRMGLAEPPMDFNGDPNMAMNYPQTSMISEEDWQKIRAYYYYAAPKKPIPRKRKLDLELDLPGFKPQVLRAKPGILPLVSMLKFLPKTGQFLVGILGGGLFRYNIKESLQPKDSLFMRSSPSFAGLTGDGDLEVLAMGQINPNDYPIGALIRVKESPDGKFFADPKIKKLKRPVHFNKADFNGDGKTDYLICQFGHLSGKLSLHLKVDTGYVEKILKPMPGARVTYCLDLDGDKKKDILALMAQGDEKVIWFRNKGKGEFEEQELLRFPPIYGSSYLEVKDMNGDGLPDLILASGDNLDYSYSLKRYHGVRIYLNRGKGVFKEKLFLPQHGTGMVMAEDFDQDGDVDLASTAYFPDYEGNPDEAFVYFENLGNLQFKARSFSGAKTGKWLVMEKGDFDADGDIDLALGAVALSNSEQLPEKTWQFYRKQGIEVLLLLNQLKK